MKNKYESHRVTDRLLKIASLSRAHLVEHWESAYGRSPPKGISRRLLEYSAAYTIQTKVLGGLKPSVRRRMEKAGPAKAKLTHSRTTSKERLPSGARLVREWHGRTHTVDVTDDGFLYEGLAYKSLSHVAREITGARWSGPRFFGL